DRLRSWSSPSRRASAGRPRPATNCANTCTAAMLRLTSPESSLHGRLREQLLQYVHSRLDEVAQLVVVSRRRVAGSEGRAWGERCGSLGAARVGESVVQPVCPACRMAGQLDESHACLESLETSRVSYLPALLDDCPDHLRAPHTSCSSHALSSGVSAGCDPSLRIMHGLPASAFYRPRTRGIASSTVCSSSASRRPAERPTL